MNRISAGNSLFLLRDRIKEEMMNLGKGKL
jgi:hypothetical protein